MTLYFIVTSSFENSSNPAAKKWQVIILINHSTTLPNFILFFL